MDIGQVGRHDRQREIDDLQSEVEGLEEEKAELQAVVDAIEELRTDGDCTIEINCPGEPLRVWGKWTRFCWLDINGESVSEALLAAVEAKRKTEACMAALVEKEGE